MNDCFSVCELLHCSTLLGALKQYMEVAGDDPRLGPAHVSLFIALLLSEKEPGHMITLHKGNLMRQSKIRSSSTYYQCMKDLDDFGYVTYCPSQSPYGDSRALMRVLPE